MISDPLRIADTPMTLIHRTGFLFLTAFFILLLSSCDDRRFFEESIKIDNGRWRSDNILPFSVVITDTSTTYNVYLDVRNDISYPFSNLYLFLKTLHPNGQVTRDTIECTLAGYDGKWLGSGSGSVRFNRFLFQRGMRFRIPGTYLLELEQAMRTEELPGIRDIGLRIDKVH